ncbi:MAG TPA: methionyl-tRNA formyltransferase [Candidatus Saccharibacteria bacterium]|nr:methionyl-tRNA formyltransferase [Candidatus Saccharibacteria bacterium]
MPLSGHSNSCVFFGSGPVAAESLELLMQHTTIEAVVTKPRPPHHKGDVPVLELAQRHNLPVVTASTKQELEQVMSEQSFTSSYAILIDFGIIVSRQVIDYFPLGIINSHFSLLPHLRGADPITWAIANGDPKTGVSLMLIDEGMDTGKLLTSRVLPIEPTDTTPSLTHKLIQLSDVLLQEYVPPYLAGTLAPKAQPHPDRATYSRKLTKADGTIDWQEPAQVIEQKIRAFHGWPQSRTRLGSVDVIITKAHVSSSQTPLSVLCGDGNYLAIDFIKPAGKNEMPAEAFLRGYTL